MRKDNHMICKYDEICKHKRGEEGVECEAQELCKFYGDTAIGGGKAKSQKKRTYKKREPREKEDSDTTQCGVTKKQFQKAKAKINQMKFYNKLDENQLKALEPMDGKRYETLTEAQRHQIVSMAKL